MGGRSAAEGEWECPRRLCRLTYESMHDGTDCDGLSDWCHKGFHCRRCCPEKSSTTADSVCTQADGTLSAALSSASREKRSRSEARTSNGGLDEVDSEAQERMKTMRGEDANGEGMDLESEIGTEKGAGGGGESENEGPEIQDERNESDSEEFEGEDDAERDEEEDEDEAALRGMPTLVDIQKSAVAEAHKIEVRTHTYQMSPAPTTIAKPTDTAASTTKATTTTTPAFTTIATSTEPITPFATTTLTTATGSPIAQGA